MLIVIQKDIPFYQSSPNLQDNRSSPYSRRRRCCSRLNKSHSFQSILEGKARCRLLIKSPKKEDHKIEDGRDRSHLAIFRLYKNSVLCHSMYDDSMYILMLPDLLGFKKIFFAVPYCAIFVTNPSCISCWRIV
jgi:hypothetical protein